MKRTVSLGVCIFVLVIGIALSSIASIMAYKTWNPAVTVAAETEKTQNAVDADGIEGEIYDEITSIKKIFDQYYIRDIDEEQLKKYALIGYVAGLEDKYAGYYDAEEYKELLDDLDGDMQGIGISVIYNYDLGGIEVIDVFPDSPAMDAGMLVGDLIVYCGEDNESVAYLGYEAALAKLRGKAGTTAKFIVYRGDDYSEEVEFSIVRDYVTEQSIRCRMSETDDKVGIIKISNFNTATITQFEEALDTLIKSGAEKLVFDVRNNPGGELHSICKVLDILVPEGPVIRIAEKDKEAETIYNSDENEIDMPMAVIVNGQTASAAELFTSCLKDYGKAVIVGEKTYGKGSMQSMIPLPDGGCIKLTTALYYPPFSDNYDGIGVEPDIESSISEENANKSIYKLEENEDTQLLDAINALNENKN